MNLTISPVRPAHPIAGIRFAADTPSQEAQDFSIRLLKKFPQFLSELEAREKKAHAELKTQYEQTSWLNFFGKLYMLFELKNSNTPKPGTGVIGIDVINMSGGRSEAARSESETREALVWLEKQKWVSLHSYTNPTGANVLWGASLTDAGKAYLNANP
jgi:hypothetical protein